MGYRALDIVPGGDVKGGSFIDDERLLPLFGDPDARRHLRWRSIFDTDQCEEADAELLKSLPSLF
ncbi:hypothetical protein [Sphingomicrobium clamense]|uniref:Uncharacterized protein n=1 Tax=Sphingomicrobium clamense TaxID=2851013 RepID=A0ABS6V4V2_9SPHN|nr:hypothetical protein [Sphingomicrobium sp. B8]MBW0144573.1 hypothetical protein [Sphingomicrobium sp. B8]